MRDILDTQYDKEIQIDDNYVDLGDDVNILQKDPAIRRIHVGFGWDLHSFNSDAMDLDFSVFLIGKNGITREDSDFVFYNNHEASNGAVKHAGDNRTGAGEGDDEAIIIDLHGVSFDVMQFAFAISIYKGSEKTQNMSMVHNAFVRIVNADTKTELMRFRLDKVLEDRKETGMIVAMINREGPKWHFVPQAEFYAGGLGEIATKYGMIVTQQ